MENENGSQAEPVGDLAHCPNCNGPGIRKGKTIACQTCDASYRYTKEGPKLVELGPFDELSDRVSKLEGGAAEPHGPQPAEPVEPQPAEPVEPQPAEPEDDGI
ncbi:hypothetical protein LCGC14_1075730 [marine sediment metagenome]|uniref:Uncharacterized protein n=1 Tax=marine sediment metagenome TaxID=412755 RepID=A0A0F9MLK9_9ZZZZ